MTHKSEMALSLAAIFLLALAVQLVITHFTGIPLPAVYDEFNYLFAADTFARGQLSNPAHPLWQFFDKGSMISTPTFMMKFPPGQSLLLALGQVLFGHPFYGVMLSVAFFAASFYWMLKSITPRHIALIGALFVIAHFAPSYWARSYMGGAAAAAGACLLLGSYLYSRNEGKPSKPLQLSLGCALLFFTRPYEGGVFFIAVALCSLWDLRKGNIRFGRPVRFFAVTTAAALLILSFQGLYNHKVTGSVLTMPYMLHTKQFAATPKFWLQKQLTPEITFPEKEGDKVYSDWRDLSGYKEIAAMTAAEKLRLFVFRTIYPLFLFLPFPLLFIAAMPWVGVDGLSRRLWSVIFAGSAASALVVWPSPHYLAATIAAILALFFYTAFRLEAKAGATPKIRALVSGALLLLCGAYFLVILGTIPKQLDKSLAEFSRQRHAAASYLDSLPAENLVFVRGAENTKYFEPWVYNRGDIDAQKTVFAYDLGRAENRKLIDYYKSLGQRRKIWLLDADRGGKLSPYR